MGTLRVCATPIGNLADASPRLREALDGAAAIACEDTRRTRALLAALGLRGELVSLHAHNEARRVPGLVARLVAGEDVALVSDAGMPGVSDPGLALVAAAHAAGVRVEVVAGPSALTAAIAAAGIPADRVAFLGFLPRGAGPLDALLDEADGWGAALVAFESPQRLPASLARIAARAPGRDVAVCRELTKLHEETVRGAAADVAARFAEPPRGEVVLVLGQLPPPAARGTATDDAALDEALAALRGAGVGARDAARIVGRVAGLPDRALYERAAAARPR